MIMPSHTENSTSEAVVYFAGLNVGLKSDHENRLYFLKGQNRSLIIVSGVLFESTYLLEQWYMRKNCSV